MLGDNKKTSLTTEECLDIFNILESSTTLGGLLVDATKKLGVKHSLYQHFTAVGALDFNNVGKFHPFNIPKEIEEFYLKDNKYDRDPVIVSAFAKGHFIWLSDSIHEPYVAKVKHENFIHYTLKSLGDGLCCPLYGPDNRKGYAFVGFGREKAEFDPIMPYQIQSLVQLMHVRYCLMMQALQRQIKLTARETEVLELISFGKTNPEIGLILGISPRTVEVHVRSVFRKLGTTDRVSTAMRAQTIEITL